VPVKVQPIAKLERRAHLEPGAVLLVVPPALALELARRQVLLERARLVVEAEEQGLRAGYAAQNEEPSAVLRGFSDALRIPSKHLLPTVEARANVISPPC